MWGGIISLPVWDEIGTLIIQCHVIGIAMSTHDTADEANEPTTMTIQIAADVNPKAVRDTLGEQYVMHQHAEDGFDYYVDEPRR